MSEPGHTVCALLVGQARWTRLIGEGLNALTQVRADVVAIDTARDVLPLLSAQRFHRADAVVRVGFRPGAHTVRGVLLDAIVETMRRRAGTPVLYYWLGTDVLNTAREVSQGRSMERFGRLASRGAHLADSDALRAELAALGISAETAWLPAPHAPQTGDPAPPPACFTVLAYVPDARPDFYDGPTLALVAGRMPNVRFRIVGGSGTWLVDPPPNIEFLGWRDDMGPLYEESSVLVRTLEHDSVSCMAIEALASGRPVVYSAEFPHTVHVAFGDAEGLEATLRALAQASDRSGTLPVDASVVSWARETADPTHCFGLIADAIERAASSRARTGGGRR